MQNTFPKSTYNLESHSLRDFPRTPHTPKSTGLDALFQARTKLSISITNTRKFMRTAQALPTLKEHLKTLENQLAILDDAVRITRLVNSTIK